jgi:Cytochrome c7 and related cytochrome c
MRYRAITLAFFLAVALFAWPRACLTTAATTGAAAPTQRRAQTERRTAPAGYARFSHRTGQHQLACDTCHKFPSTNWQQVRKKDEAFPDITEFPEHHSCLNCHRRQFFARERPAPVICSVCHVASSPRNTTRYSFPSLAAAFVASPRGQDFASDFSIYFTHDKHIELVGRAEPDVSPAARVRFATTSFAQEKKQEKKQEKQEKKAEAPQADKSCSVCHQTYQPQGDSNDEYVTKPPKNLDDAFWLKRGTFKTIPVGHAACFTCHSQDNTDLKPGPAECATCHRFALAPPAPAHMDFDPQTAITEGITDHTILAAWRKRTSAAAFRHEGGLHPTLTCTTCHNVTKLDTLDDRTKVIPVRTCGGAGTGCHIATTADEVGALNFELDAKRAKPAFQCVKCHLNYGKEPIPQSHASALPALKAQ